MNTFPDLEQFRALACAGVRFPVVRELPLNSLTAVDLLARTRGSFPGCILESGKAGRYSYVIPRAERVWMSKGEQCSMSGEEDGSGNPFHLLRKYFKNEILIPNSRLCNFSGGAVGYFSYDMARHVEQLPDLAADDLCLPDSYLMFVDRFYEVDPVDGLLRVVYLPLLDDQPYDEQYHRILDVIAQMEEACSNAAVSNYRTSDTIESVLEDGANLTQDDFEALVRIAQEYILAGDIFQVNLSVRFHRSYHDDPLELYRALRAINPSPYMSYFELENFSIVSASPELLIQVRDRVIETRPIAGTRPRGANREEDIANARELIDNEKERAEHLMLVDLERNDIGRVSRFGSVRVDDFMEIEEYSHVIHIVSHVRGELADGFDMFDAIIACFPGGTITGAPKVRSMEIIEELEPVRRGLYTGSIGWLGFDGAATLNIVIRTIVVGNGIAYVQAGAGIVADSEPANEYRESVRKAQAGLQAIEQVRNNRAVHR